MIKISFIIPVYNTEKYIELCLDSVVNQVSDDMKNKIEIIVINDGSKDNSLYLVKEYESRNEFVRVITQENKGLSEARNTGIKNSAGQYIIFLDSDDLIADNTIRDLLKYCDGTDLIFMDTMKFYPDGNTIPFRDSFQKEKIDNQEKKVVLDHLANQPKFAGESWNKMVRRQLILDNNIFFTPNIYSEDIDWVLDVLANATKFKYFDKKPYYYYRQGRINSITQNISIKNVKSLIYILEKWNSKQKIDDKYKVYFSSFLCYEYTILLLTYSKLSKTDRRKVKRKINELSLILKDSDRVLYKNLYKVIRMTNIDVVSKIISKYASRKR